MKWIIGIFLILIVLAVGFFIGNRTSVAAIKPTIKPSPVVLCNSKIPCPDGTFCKLKDSILVCEKP